MSNFLTSNKFIAIVIMSKSKTEKSKFKIIRGALYACNPPFGVVVPLLFIQPKFQNSNVTSALFGIL